MTGPVYDTGLELRAAGDGSRRLSGSFPYLSLAVIDSGGNGRRPKKEQFAEGAFSWGLEQPPSERDVHLLIGHSFDKPLASRKAGTLLFSDTKQALKFEAILTPEIMRTTWGADFLAAFQAGLVGGISPGFRVAPKEVVPIPEEITDEDESLGEALIRTIFAAILFELSLVTRPAYHDTNVDLRAWEKSQNFWNLPMRNSAQALRRWRL